MSQRATTLILGKAAEHPIDIRLTLQRYLSFGEDAANRWDGRTFSKVLRFASGLHCVQITDDGDLRVVCTPALPDEQSVVLLEKHARHILGLDFDLKTFAGHAAEDDVLRPLVQRYSGLRPTLVADAFEMLVTSISAQQINLRFAFKVRSRLVRAFGTPFSFQGETLYAFPTPEQLAGTDPARLHELQFTRRKAEYIVGLAEKMASGELDQERLYQLPEAEIREKLLAVRGLGHWCVDWFLARGAGYGAAFPAGDLGVRKAVQFFYFDNQNVDEATLRRFARRWGVHSNLAVHYLLAGWMDAAGKNTPAKSTSRS